MRGSAGIYFFHDLLIFFRHRLIRRTRCSQNTVQCHQLLIDVLSAAAAATVVVFYILFHHASAVSISL